MDTRDSNDIEKDNVIFNNFSTKGINVHRSSKKSAQNVLPVVYNDTKINLNCYSKAKKKRVSEAFNECGECLCKIKNYDFVTCMNCELDFHVNCIEKSSMSKGFKIAHLNVCSLRHKVDDVRILLNENDIDILCLTETWLDKNINDGDIRIDGYKLSRFDRVVDMEHGGILCYLNGWQLAKMEKSIPDMSLS